MHISFCSSFNGPVVLGMCISIHPCQLKHHSALHYRRAS
uniref:Uncharacterized protein n=1 Tax=Arundo donax TaxID=35708 RepID=A0A0A9D1V0_ARUDO